LYTDFIVDNPFIKGAYATWGSAFGHETAYWGGAYVSGLIKKWLDELVMCPDSIGIEKEVEQHEAYDSWWANLEADGPYGDHFPSDHIPAIHRAGWWDIFQQEMLNTYEGAVAEADPAVRDSQWLFVEPLGHCEGSASDFGYPNYTINDWFTMSVALFEGNMSDPVFSRTSNLNFYVLGTVPKFVAKGTAITGNYWCSLKTWPTFVNTNYYINSDGTLSTTKPSTGGQLSYKYDPNNPVPTDGGNNLLVHPCGPQDQTKQVESRADVLKFTTTTALSQTMALCGHVTATIFVSSDQVDTDFYVSLTDVYPNGESVLIRYGALRMRWRDSDNTTSLMKPGQVYMVTVDMWSVAYIFDAGHMIRVLVTSSNSPQFAPNPNNGHLLADSDQPVYIANNTVYTGAAQASYVTLPIVDVNSLPKNNQIQ